MISKPLIYLNTLFRKYEIKLLTSLRVGAKRGYCSLSVYVCVCVCVCVCTACYRGLFLNCYNLASEALAATNVEQRIEKRVDFTTVVSRTSSRKRKA